MTCDPQTIICSIDQLTQSLDEFNLNSFLATALATLLGVVAGAGLSFLLTTILRRQDRVITERKQMNEALTRMNSDIAAFSHHLRTSRPTFFRRKAHLVEDWPVLASIASARILATDSTDIAILDKVRDLVRAGRGTDHVSRTNNLSYVWRTFIVWRDGRDSELILSELDALIDATKRSQTWTLEMSAAAAQ
ncbi:hypothetical protein QCD70_12595 [Agreia sp. PsM10]|uniref:hypothetical protein n=1 Tax=Agreia sp. PsM10 TaxID=3030533 RepID=UPI00263AC0C4|nr:hypothetical protein [Agreia sp. PsM10]MDN4641089.1 hypothetical protein [Agreia sp. PsM10]